MNRLAECSSPYLRQHADNPVAWWPWCPEAFAEARRRDVPVLISIGYSTCHWCHVMAHESFEDAETASLMNERLVCIKVDREERPEVDAIYMDAVQALSGRGGWPLNAFADHDGRPFHALTYLPRAHWQRTVAQVAEVWSADRPRIAEACANLMAHLAQDDASTAGTLDPAVRETLDRQLRQAYDADHPGFTWGGQRAPKFPPSQLIHLLLDDRDEARASLAMAVLTAMQDGGIHDRVGGGFHRYSVDREWRVPHFEKMLYDNAQLMGAYARAHLRTGRADFLATAVNAADYILRDLRVYDAGRFLGYAAAEDADDPGGEGSFYAWSPQQLADALGSERGSRLAAEWDISPAGPQHAHHGHPEPVAEHIPHPRAAAGDPAPRRAAWEDVLPILRAARGPRPRPGRDDKVLTDQNGLALEGLAWVARASGEARHAAAVRELATILAGRHPAGGLLRLPGLPAVVTDYGALACGLLAAFDLLGDPALVGRAAAVVDEAVARLAADDGGFYTAPAGRADLVRRGREHLDNAWPSGEAQLAVAAARLHHLTGEPRWRGIAAGAVAAAAGMASRAPANAATILHAADLLADATVAVATASGLLASAARGWHGRDVLIVPAASCAGAAWHCLAERTGIGEELLLVCRGTTCLLPARTAQEARERLAG